ncbi:PilZ domain-containing protein [Pseudomonas panipatensis]
MGKLAQLESRLGELMHTLEENTAQIHTTGVVSADLHQVSERLRQVMQSFHFDSLQTVVPAPDDQRKTPRVMQNLMVEVRDGGREQFATSADFSMSGIRLKLAQPLQAGKGDSLELLIRQPSDNRAEYDRQQPFPVKARVKWQTQGEGSYNYGLAFETLDASARDKLKACITYYNQAPFYETGAVA